MSNPNDFIIENGVLKKYNGTETDITLPEGLTGIGYGAFYKCALLQTVTIPDGVTRIGHHAFDECGSLQSVIIPGSVCDIGYYAFSKCSSLKNATLPDGVEAILKEAFCGCNSLQSVTIPASVTSIGDSAFRQCESLQSVTIPAGVTSIGDCAFCGCNSLQNVTIPDSVTSIGNYAFCGCEKLADPDGLIIVKGIVFDYCGQGGSVSIPTGVTRIGEKAFQFRESLQGVTIPAGVTSIGDSAFGGCESLQSVTIPSGVTSIGDAAFYCCKSLQSVTIPDSVTSIGESAFYGCSGVTSFVLPAHPDVKNVGKNAFVGCGGLALRIDNKKRRAEFLKKHGFSAAFVKIAEENTLLLFADVLPAVLGPVLAYPFGEVEKKEYKKAALDTYTKNPYAAAEAEKLDHAALMELLKLFMETDAPKVAARWYAPYAAYANEEELAALLAEMKEWEKDSKKKEQIIRVRGAILLNDTVFAMRYADSLGLLERYAEMRGTTADDLRDNIISDFGLDETGRRTWTLAGRTITAALNADLTLTLTDEDGKALKSVPKKGADPAEYEAVNKEFTAMKKDIKSTAKLRNDKIFADFLSGRARPAADWQKAYLKNPVLRALARLIVWEQDGDTFILNAEGSPVTVDGKEYEITDTPVKVAHPMEMEKADVEAWQHYFTSNALKQPFEQVWEPVADASLVKPGRYDGCTVPLYMLMNKEKHGIIMEGRSRITLKDCSADLIYIEGHHDWINNEFEVKNFTFKEYTRQVNHIVCHLDKGTVAGRVKKDDVSAAQWFDRFTPAQIRDFVELASKNNAVNVLALLLDYQNTHFADFDPMDEFTLDW